jgi:hypothetical protein
MRKPRQECFSPSKQKQKKQERQQQECSVHELVDPFYTGEKHRDQMDIALFQHTRLASYREINSTDTRSVEFVERCLVVYDRNVLQSCASISQRIPIMRMIEKYHPFDTFLSDCQTIVTRLEKNTCTKSKKIDNQSSVIPFYARSEDDFDYRELDDQIPYYENPFRD